MGEVGWGEREGREVGELGGGWVGVGGKGEERSRDEGIEVGARVWAQG